MQNPCFVSPRPVAGQVRTDQDNTRQLPVQVFRNHGASPDPGSLTSAEHYIIDMMWYSLHRLCLDLQQRVHTALTGAVLRTNWQSLSIWNITQKGTMETNAKNI